MVICEPEPEFRRFGAEADDVSESGGRVVGLGFVTGLDRLFQGRLREDCVYEGCVADLL